MFTCYGMSVTAYHNVIDIMANSVFVHTVNIIDHESGIDPATHLGGSQMMCAG